MPVTLIAPDRSNPLATDACEPDIGKVKHALSITIGGTLATCESSHVFNFSFPICNHPFSEDPP